MPIYDYICSTCSTRTEFIHGIDAPAPRFCPACGAEDTLRKAFVTPAVHFKGSGWAKKDRSTAASSKTKAGAAEGSSDGVNASGRDGATGEAGSKGESGSKGDGGSGSDGGSKADGGARSDGASAGRKDSPATKRAEPSSGNQSASSSASTER